MTAGKAYLVSVVRDYGMYRRCIAENPCCEGLTLVPLDNRQENLAIPDRYNRFLDGLEEDGWVVFCHEDWMPLEPLLPRLAGLDKRCLYGPVGAKTEVCPHADFIHITGSIEQCRKDGSHRRRVRGTWKGGDTDTFDCQCLIVHSSVISRCSLRFDPELRFDLYAEDFCAAAWWRHGVPSRILPLRCRHYSGGVLGDRFWKGLDYLREKYRSCPKRFPTPVGRRNTFGGDQQKPIYNFRRSPWARLRYLIRK